ncbi:hypothetical protein VTN02DRAFT_1523 [Thermoascus thermophilus]
MLTHTLHLPPAPSEIYGGPRPEWLRDLLDYLPCLQSLMVSELPFFDHNAMVALRTQPASRQTYNLRLLLAEREPNATSAGIAEALSRFPALVYLDLSYTTAARDRTVLSTLYLLPDLQVLKLRGIGLKDADAELIADAIGTRVRFLDLRNNRLTDMAVRSLMRASFLPPEDSFDDGRDAASRIRRPSSRLGDLLKSPELDDMFTQQLSRPLTGHSFFENLPHDGITHLYLADNQLTVEGVAGLLASGRLHILDVGTVDTAQSITRGQSAVPHGRGDSSAGFPGAEELIPILGASAKEHLTYLRVHHAVVTKETPVRNKISPAVLLPELPGEIAHSELSAAQPILELDAGNGIVELQSKSGPISELADTSVSLATSINGTNGVRHTRDEDEPSPEIRRGSVFEPGTEHGNIILDARGTDLSLSRPSPTQEQPSPFSTLSADHWSGIPNPTIEPSSPTPAPDLQSQKIQELLAKRPKRSTLPLRNSKDAAFPYLHPSHVPHLETLVLTDVPSHVPVNSPILSSLIRFITACSNEELLATLQARSNYSLPPGRARINAEKQHARDLFSLRRLILEITPVSKGRSGKKNPSPWKPEGYHNMAFKSSAGDQDSENLWSAAMNDFSFFGNEECGSPENDPGTYFPMPVLDEKVVLVPEDERPNHSRPSSAEIDFSSPLSPSSPYNDHHNNTTLHQPSPHRRPQQRRSRPNSRTLQPTSSPVGSSPSVSLHPPANISKNRETQPRDTFEEPEIDLVSELAAFRRSKRAEYEALVNGARGQHNNSNNNNSRSTLTSSSSSLVSPLSSASTSTSRSPSPSQFPVPSPTTGTMEHHHHRHHHHHKSTAIPLSVEGHWRGEVKIVRNAAPKGRRSGVVDLFGSYYSEKG